MGRSGKSNAIREARRIKATLAAHSAAEFERFLSASQGNAESTDSASAYVGNRALTNVAQRGTERA